MKRTLKLEDRISINPNYAFKYLHIANKFQFENNFKSHSNRKQTFEMNKQSIRKVRNCFAWLNLISDKKVVYSKKECKKFTFRMCFITLTLPDKQKHHDNFVKGHMLEPFLYWMKRYCDCQSYIWKAEAQKNGNIHFHITSNKFIHWKSVRAKWNKICAKHGYCKIFQDGSNDKGNAATQIKAVKKEAQIARYMVKYFCKNERDKRPIDGRLWGASVNLNVPNFVYSEHGGTYLPVYNNLERNPFVRKIQSDTGMLYVWDKKIFKYLPISVRNDFKKKVRAMKLNDHVQTYIEVESIY